MSKRYAVVVAGGKGLRMGTDIPKQFLPVGGKPVLMRTLETFMRWDASVGLVLVLPAEQQPYWRELCEQYNFRLPVCLANGGETRFHSVRNGLACVPPDATTIAVHDGVRPFVSENVLAASFACAEQTQAAVPVVPVVDSLRRVDAEGVSSAAPRSAYRLVQTPQVFAASLLRQAYEQPYCSDFTDDASVIEALGVSVTLVEGNRENIKITTPFDLLVAEALVAKSSE